MNHHKQPSPFDADYIPQIHIKDKPLKRVVLTQPVRNSLVKFPVDDSLKWVRLCKANI